MTVRAVENWLNVGEATVQRWQKRAIERLAYILYIKELQLRDERQIILKKPSLAIIMDRVGSVKDAEIRSRLHPGGELKINGQYFTIESPSGSVVVVPFSDGNARIEEGKHGSISVNDDVDFKWIPYVDCIVNAASKNTITGYIIFPFEEDEKIKSVTQSIHLTGGAGGEITLIFNLAGNRYNFSFPGGV